MALTASVLGTQSGTTGARTITFGATPTAGDVLAVIISIASEAGTLTGITSGWTAGPASPTGGTDNFWSATYYKISDGTETSFGYTVGASGGTHQAIAVSVAGFVGTATLEGSSEDETNIDTSTTSQSSGTAANTTAAAAAIALFGTDRWDTWETGYAFGSSFTEIGKVTTSGGRPGAFAAFLELSATGSYSCAATTSDSGDQAYGAILVFGDVTSGGSISGDAAITEEDDTAAAAGTVDVAGAAALTEDADTAAATGTLAVAGAADVAEADDAVSAAGAVDVSGAASITEADDTLASDGTVAAGGGVSGDAAITEADDTAAAAGTVAVAGAADISEAGDTVSATGAVAVLGDASVLEDGDTLSAAGTVAAPGGDITGQAAIVEGDDTVQAAGTAQTPMPPAEDPFWLYRDQDRAINEDSFPHTGRSSDMLKLFRRFRRRA